MLISPSKMDSEVNVGFSGARANFGQAAPRWTTLEESRGSQTLQKLCPTLSPSRQIGSQSHQIGHQSLKMTPTWLYGQDFATFPLIHHYNLCKLHTKREFILHTHLYFSFRFALTRGAPELHSTQFEDDRYKQINSNSVAQQPMRVRAYCAHPSMCHRWALRCMNRYPGQVDSLKRDPSV
ncbi:hypothetical protein TNCV_2267671 [Trichonephila clavipes]|nr:hypothetical protein TNCV_2267671 [Trichonephila clavipes]